MRPKLINSFIPLVAVLTLLSAAVSARGQGIQVTISPTAVTLSNSQQAQFTATVAGAPGPEVVWAASPNNVGSLNQSGLYTAPASITTQQTVTITVSSQYDVNAKATAVVTLMPPSVSLVISPRTGLSVKANGQVALYAAVAGTANQNVTWSVDGVNNGSVTPTLAPNTVYKAPASISSQRTVTVRAVSQADPTVQDSVQITLLATVNSVSVTNTCGVTTLTNNQQCQFTASVLPAGIDQTVTWSVFPALGTISGGLYTAPADITITQNVTITATSAADTTKSSSATITLTPPTATAVTVSPATAALTNGQTQQFVATVTGAPVTDVTWSISPTSLGSINSSGLYTAPANLVASATVTVIARSTYDATKTGTAVVTLTPTVAVSVKPATATVAPGDSVTFTATVTGSANTDVQWTLSPAVGAITAAGVYTAPSSVAAAQVVTVTATSVADPTKYASAIITVQPVITVTVSPASVTLNNSQTQQFVATVTGAPVTDVTWSVTPSSLGAINSAGMYTAPGNLVAPATATVTARSVYDSTKFATATVNLVPIFITVSVSPSAVALTPSQTQQFSATVSGTSTTDVTWSLSPSSGYGSINSQGLYTAPANITANQTVTVIAKSVADPSKSGTATVTLMPMVGVTVKPAAANLQAGEQASFTATVVGTLSTDVTWSLSPNLGAITSTAAGAVTYTAPDSIPANQTVLLIATSVADPGKSGVANINLVKSSLVQLSITPKTVTLNAGQTQQFTVTVTGTTVTDVFWTINPPTAGTISQTGLYTAPDKITATQTVTLTAYSLLDSSRTVTATITLSPATTVIDIGTNAPNDSIKQLFVQAFYRGSFSTAVSLPPSAIVRRYGSTGWYQTFQDANKTSGVTFALVKGNANLLLADGSPASVWQVWGDVFSTYNSIGANTAGYPTADTQSCPFFSVLNSCMYQLFDRNYAVFGYKSALATGQGFYIRNQFYTKWTAQGGLSGPGRPVDSEISVTSAKGGNATTQTYSNGAIYNMTSGALSGQTWAVVEPIYSLYLANAGHQGSLGFPTSDMITLSSGVRRQQFQGGAIDYTPGTDPGYRAPVALVAIQVTGGGNAVAMKLGDAVQVSAAAAAANGAVLEGRPISWSTTNSRVVQVAGSGTNVTLKAVGGGNAVVRASSEGKVSPPLNVTVNAPCCQVGEGAPSAAVQQAFLDAVTRNRFNFVLPAAGSVERVGKGYLQQFEAVGTGTHFLLAKPDSSAVAYFVTGDVLARYLELGGPGGKLGYPLSDPTAAGRQVFENGALAGMPVRAVSGAILKKWALLNYEAGPAGMPVTDSGIVTTFTASSGAGQGFAGGFIYAYTAGPHNGQAFFVSGPILERYLALGGPGGAFGLPASDEFASGDTRRQNFEGGYFDYAAGEAVAHEHAAERQPAVLAAPTAVMPGSRVRLSVYGFADGATIRVSVAGRPDFQVTTANGSYAWEVMIPANATPGVVEIRAVDIATNATAEGSYEVKSYLDAGVRLVKVQGDNQSGAPGALLPQALRVALRDDAGSPVSGATVVFQASPGGVVSPASAITDLDGQAETWLRLPLSGGLAGATADAPGVAPQPVTFNVRAAAQTLVNFPRLMQSSAKGALVASVASILQYHQNRGDLTVERGPADPAALNQFLSGLPDGFLSNPDSGTQVANLWRAGEFVSSGADVSVERPDPDTVRDLVAQGSPVLLSLAMTADGAPAGGHFVVAIGVADDGGIVVHDPNPDLTHATLGEYLTGFSASGRQWQAALRGAVRFPLRTPPAKRFLIAAIGIPAARLDSMTLQARSVAGACGQTLELMDPSTPSISRFVYCDGAQPFYQIDVGDTQPFRASVIDFNGGGVSDISGSAPAAWRASRNGTQLVLSRQDVALAPNGVVNAATFTPGTAPGGLISIFGSGLAGPGGETQVRIDGVEAPVVSATSFQVNVQVPPEASPGSSVLTVSSPYGTAQQGFEIRNIAPAIFQVSPGMGAVVNQDGKLNGPGAPARRGQVLLIYATGLGAVTAQGNLSVVTEQVKVVVDGRELPVAFAGFAPGLTGVYQVNVAIPATFAPGLDLPLLLRQAGVDSAPVPVSVAW